MHLVYFEPSNNAKSSALRLMQEAHTLAQLEKHSLSPRRAVLSSLLWNVRNESFFRASGILAKNLPKTRGGTSL